VIREARTTFKKGEWQPEIMVAILVRFFKKGVIARFVMDKPLIEILFKVYVDLR
jgi:hypothetical protein